MRERALPVLVALIESQGHHIVSTRRATTTAESHLALIGRRMRGAQCSAVSSRQPSIRRASDSGSRIHHYQPLPTNIIIIITIPSPSSRSKPPSVTVHICRSFPPPPLPSSFERRSFAQLRVNSRIQSSRLRLDLLLSSSSYCSSLRQLSSGQ